LGATAIIRRRDPDARGVSAQNLWRMREFYETWRGEKKLSPLARELDWSNNLLILGKRKRSEEREFYLRLPLCCQPFSSATSFSFFVFLLSSLADGLVVWERGE
jgi:hypothetical protein